MSQSGDDDDLVDTVSVKSGLRFNDGDDLLSNSGDESKVTVNVIKWKPVRELKHIDDETKENIEEQRRLFYAELESLNKRDKSTIITQQELDEIIDMTLHPEDYPKRKGNLFYRLAKVSRVATFPLKQQGRVHVLLHTGGLTEEEIVTQGLELPRYISIEDIFDIIRDTHVKVLGIFVT